MADVYFSRFIKCLFSTESHSSRFHKITKSHIIMKARSTPPPLWEFLLRGGRDKVLELGTLLNCPTITVQFLCMPWFSHHLLFINQAQTIGSAYLGEIRMLKCINPNEKEDNKYFWCLSLSSPGADLNPEVGVQVHTSIWGGSNWREYRLGRKAVRYGTEES